MPTLAPTLYNPGSRGQNSRYDISGLQRRSDGRYTDGTWSYDENGLSWDRPDVFVPGLKPADQMDSEGSGFSRPGSGSLLAGDSTYNQLMQDLKSQSVSDKASRDAAIKKSFINFGLGNFDLAKAAQSTGIGELASILDPQTLELAKNNQFSVQKRLERGLADRQRDNRVSLRQRGGVRSGESGFLAQRAQTDFDTGVYDSTQQLLDFLSGSQSAFAQAENERKRREFEAAMAAASRYSGPGGDYGDDYGDFDPSFGLAPAGNYLFGGVDQLLGGAKKTAAPRPKFTYAGTVVKKGKAAPYARRGGI